MHFMLSTELFHRADAALPLLTGLAGLAGLRGPKEPSNLSGLRAPAGNESHCIDLV